MPIFQAQMDNGPKVANDYDYGSSILLDASGRRFRANKICRQAAAATRWVNVRNSILQGQRPDVHHAYQLMHCDQALEAVSRPTSITLLDPTRRL